MRLVATALLIQLLPAMAAAGAWTQPAGRSQLIISATTYHSDKRREDSSITTRQPTYRKTAINPYYEYGLTDHITLGANLFLIHASQQGSSQTGLGDSEFFLRHHLLSYKSWVWSIEPMIKLPSPHSTSDTPSLGGNSADLGLTTRAGYSFRALSRSHYLDLASGYHYRFGSPLDQIKLSAALGIGLSPSWSLLSQLDTVWRVSEPQITRFTQSPADDYSLIKTQFSALYHHSENTRWQVGLFSHLDGRNTGLGTGFIVSAWRNF